MYDRVEIKPNEEEENNDNIWTDLINNPEKFLSGDDGVHIIIEDDDLTAYQTGLVPMCMYYTAQGMRINSTEAASKKKSVIIGEQNVYWLPWDENKTNAISIDELNQSGCLVFLTSTFSGCRFNLKGDSVEHVPASTQDSVDTLQKDRPDLSSTTLQFAALARDIGELSIAPDQDRSQHKTVRRTLTPTELSELEFAEKHTYEASKDPEGEIDNVVVIGVRKTTNDPFHFYGQKFDCKKSLSLINFGEAGVPNLQTGSATVAATTTFTVTMSTTTIVSPVSSPSSPFITSEASANLPTSTAAMLIRLNPQAPNSNDAAPTKKRRLQQSNVQSTECRKEKVLKLEESAEETKEKLLKKQSQESEDDDEKEYDSSCKPQ